MRIEWTEEYQKRVRRSDFMAAWAVLAVVVLWGLMVLSAYYFPWLLMGVAAAVTLGVIYLLLRAILRWVLWLGRETVAYFRGELEIK